MRVDGLVKWRWAQLRESRRVVPRRGDLDQPHKTVWRGKLGGKSSAY